MRRPRAEEDWFEDRTSPNATISVHEPEDNGPEPTGLYDQHGNELYRVADTVRPVGFLSQWSEDDED